MAYSIGEINNDMKAHNNEEKMAEIFGFISEQAIRKASPFDNLPIKDRNYNYTYSNYLKIRDDIDMTLNNEITEAIIEKAKYNIKDSIISGLKDFAEIYPNHSKAIRKLFDLVKQKNINTIDPEGILRVFIDQDEKINITNITKKIFKDNLPEYRYCKKRHPTGALKFAKEFCEEKNLVILVDVGRKRNWLHFFVGIEKPEVLVDINNLFLLNKRTFEFKTKEDAEEILLNAVELINKAMFVLSQKAVRSKN